MKRNIVTLAMLLISAGVLFAGCNKEYTEEPKTENSKPKPEPEPGPADKPMVVAYLPVAEYGDFDIRWEAITHLNLAFIYPNEDGTISDYQLSALLPEIIQEAHNNDVKVIISIRDEAPGRFSEAIANHRSKLVDNILDYVRTHHLDGYDIDYEDWTGENTARNLVEFIKELYQKKDDNMWQTCAVNTTDRGYTIEWHTYFDIINIMAYDWHGPWNTEGQHSPYEESIASIEFWKNELKAPARKLTLGLPFYGYSWNDGDSPGRAYRYSEILEKYPEEDIPGKDQVERIYYNGKATIVKKCGWALENQIGGVMIWQIGQDAKKEEDSLLKAIGGVMFGN